MGHSVRTQQIFHIFSYSYAAIFLKTLVTFCFAHAYTTGAVTEVEVLGCGVISWKPPPGNEGLALNYIIRFFDGSSYSDSASSYRTIQRHPEDIGRHWARAENLPTDGRTIYADVSVNKNLFYCNFSKKL